MKKLTVQKFYDFITEQMTPEQALKKLLESSLIQYEHLKFDKKDNPVHPLFIITMAALDMNWGIALEKGKEDDNVNGLVLGTKKYIKKILKKSK